MCGLPGSGKSTLAEQLAPRLGAELLGSDRLRTELGLRGDYRDVAVAAVYREMFARALRVARSGRPVVLDATFARASYRTQAYAAARQAGARCALIEVTADEATTLERVARARDFSEAGERAYRELRAHFEPIADPHLTLDSSALGIEDMAEAAVAHLTGR